MMTQTFYTGRGGRGGEAGAAFPDIPTAVPRVRAAPTDDDFDVRSELAAEGGRGGRGKGKGRGLSEHAKEQRDLKRKVLSQPSTSVGPTSTMYAPESSATSSARRISICNAYVLLPFCCHGHAMERRNLKRKVRFFVVVSAALPGWSCSIASLFRQTCSTEGPIQRNVHIFFQHIGAV